MYYCTIFMCVGVSCQTNNSLELKEYFVKEIKRRNLEEYIKIYPNGCLGTCQKGPSMVIVHEALGLIRYVHIKDKKTIDKIIDETLLKGLLLKENYLEKHERED